MGLNSEENKTVWFKPHFVGDVSLELHVFPYGGSCMVLLLVEPIMLEGYAFLLNGYERRNSPLVATAHTAIGKFLKGRDPKILATGQGGLIERKKYRVNIKRKGSQLRLYINRRLCGLTKDSSYNCGRIGFSGPYYVMRMLVSGTVNPRWCDKELSSLGDRQAHFEQAKEFGDIRLKLGLPPGVSISPKIAQLKLPYEEENEHYKIITSVSKSFAHRISIFSEKMFRFYSKVFPVSKKKIYKSRIVIFKTENEFRSLGVPSPVLGFYSPDTKGLYLYDHVNQLITREVLLHEGFHQFIDLILEDVPLWFNEGMAQYFQTAQPTRTGFKCGYFPTALNLLKALRLSSMLDFPLISDEEFRNPRKILANYAKAWGLCYFLIHYKGGKYFPVLKAYFKALRRGLDRREAYNVSFGKVSLHIFEKEFAEFIRELGSESE